jgi:hypothetical protein
MNYNDFYKYKTKYKDFDSKILNSIKKQMKQSNIFYKTVKTKNNYIKSNIINIILNKICINNVNIITEEFFNKIKIDEENINMFNKLFYKKILNESNFILANAKFYINYFNEQYKNYTTLDETKRKNFIYFIKELINHNLFNNDIVSTMIDYFYNNKLYIDIYYILYQTKYIANYKDLISKLLLINDIRLQTLLESLYLEKKEKKVIKKNINISNNINIEIENVLDEYLFLKDINEIKLYLKENNNFSVFMAVLKSTMNNNKDLYNLYNKLKKNTKIVNKIHL